jgi:hypothetical protein
LTQSLITACCFKKAFLPFDWMAACRPKKICLKIPDANLMQKKRQKNRKNPPEFFMQPKIKWRGNLKWKQGNKFLFRGLFFAFNRNTIYLKPL